MTGSTEKTVERESQEGGAKEFAERALESRSLVEGEAVTVKDIRVREVIHVEESRLL